MLDFDTNALYLPSDAEINEAAHKALGRHVCVRVHSSAPRSYWNEFESRSARRPASAARTDARSQSKAFFCENMTDEDGPYNQFTPACDYLNDRNTLPEVWSAVEKAGRRQAFFALLRESVGASDGVDMWPLLTAPARVHLTAALKVLDAWPDTWRTPAPVE